MKSSTCCNLPRTAIALLAVAFLAFTPALGAQDEPPPVEVTIDVAGNAVPGGLVRATATVEIQDGSTLESFAWTQAGGLEANLAAATTPTVRARLKGRAQYRRHLVDVLAEPPVGPEELPENVPFPEAEEGFPGGLQNRYQVVGVNPFALEEAGLLELEVAVTTSSGTWHATAEVHVDLPWKPAAGIRNVPIGIPVLLQGKEQARYDWTLAVPAGSEASLRGRRSQNPEFLPDVPGIYTAAVTDMATGDLVEVVIYSGYWRGIIVDQNAEGRPVPEGICTSCHRETFVEDKFTPWLETGHAEVFTNNLNTNSHYGSRCFSCHSVGYDPEVDNGGIDEAPDFQAFMDSGLLANPDPDNWTEMLERFPATAQLANAQCENCHGPADSVPRQDTLAHGWRPEVTDEPRVSLASDTCAVCHGEPLRHARFQQWQLSGHANYELATGLGTNGSCARCHSVNGFLEWLPVLLGEEPGDPTADIEVSWTADETHPQTCVTCHDPHDIGRSSGTQNDAVMRIAGDTPPLIGGFRVVAAGRGALCMTCHNSRRGLRNDATFADIVGTSEAARAPHGSSQTDVLMGENAFFVNTGVRGPHSLIEDTCTTCHMVSTPPPDVLSYNQGGTNHTFFAGDAICAECHGELFTADTVQTVVGAVADDLQGLIEGALLDLIAEQIAAGNTIDLNGQAVITDEADIAAIDFGEFRGRQSMTVVFTDGTAVGPNRMTDIEVVQPAPLPAMALYDVASEGLIKAGWNYNLVINDGSGGVHNPFFVLEALDGARDALGGRGGPRAELPPAPVVQ